MPFKVVRWNEARGTTVDVPGADVANRRRAFDRAWDNCGTLIKNNIRQSHGARGDRDKPPASDMRFKIWIELRPGQGRGLHLRYDYPTGTPPNNPEGTWETNEIRWRIVRVP